MGGKPLEHSGRVSKYDGKNRIGDRIRENRQHGYYQNKAGATPGMMRRETMGRLHGQRQVGFKGENRFMLRSMILEYSIEATEPGEDPDIRQEYGQPDTSRHKIEF